MLEEPKSSTPLNKFGEFGLIKHLTETIELVNPESIKGIGDDAAILRFDKDNDILMTSDMLVEGVHFDISYTPLKHLGYKAAVVNFSDIYAMMGAPKQMTLSMAVSSKYTVEALEEIYEGLLTACKVYGVDLVGGDTTSALYGLVLSITVTGTVEKDKAVKRDTAQKGDLLVVSGDLGGAYMGLQLLEREKLVFKEHPTTQPDLEGHDYILERQLKPEARKDIVEKLKEYEITPTSMIDVSDGLSSEIMHICKSSKLGCKLYEDKIPIDPTTFNMAREFELDPTTCALNGGEDYELLFTIKQDDFEKIKNDIDLSVIGYMAEEREGTVLIDKSGGVHPLVAQGWKVFDSEM
jgi:thiamine-monophosphate kinase